MAISNDSSAFDSEAKARLKLGLFSYPVLQAADILIHGYVISVLLRLLLT